MLGEVFCAVGRHARSVKQRALFVIRNTISAFDDNHNFKVDLHEHQTNTLNAVDKHRTRINEARKAKAKKKLSQNAPKLIEDIPKNRWKILDITLLDNIVRGEPDIAKERPYKSMPATAAQAIIRQVIEDFKSFHKAIEAYAKDPSKFTGRPNMPAYSKNEECSFEIPLGNTSNGHLPALGKKRIGIDKQCSKFLTAKQKATWDEFDLGEDIRELEKHLPKGAVPVLFRVTFNNGRPKMEVVFNIDVEIDDSSIFAQAYTIANKVAGTKKDRLGRVKQKEPTDEMLMKALQSLPPSKKVAGADFGLNNACAIGFANGSRGMVVSSTRIRRRINKSQQEIDQFLSDNTCDELKDLQAKKLLVVEKNKDIKIKFTRKDKVRMANLLKAIYAIPKYRKLTGKLARWKNDIFKKLSGDIMRELQKRGIQCFIVGRNKGWKNGCNMRRSNNREFHNIPHALIYSMLKAYGEKAGILVLSTEESYTSKISFLNNVPLRKFEEKEELNNKASNEITKTTTREEDTQDGVDTNLPRSGRTKKENGGYRSSANRNVYINEDIENKPKNWKKSVHADLQGSFNMMRKVVDWFYFNDTLTMNYDLYWMSPKLGLTKSISRKEKCFTHLNF